FFEWLEVYDNVENTNFHQAGPPRDFVKLAPLLRRFFLRVAEEKEKWRGITLVVDFPEKLIPASEEANASIDERMNLVTFLKWAAAPELARMDIGVILVAESATELHAICCKTRMLRRSALTCPMLTSGSFFFSP